MTQDLYRFGQRDYIQSGLVGDFIPEPRCSKSIVGLQTREREREMGCPVGPDGRAEIDRSYAMNEVSIPKPELEEVDLG